MHEINSKGTNAAEQYKMNNVLLFSLLTLNQYLPVGNTLKFIQSSPEIVSFAKL